MGGVCLGSQGCLVVKNAKRVSPKPDKHVYIAPQTNRAVGSFTGQNSGSPDALKGAPDASGAHRTHAQRGSQNACTPDANHRMHRPASGACRPVPYPSWARHYLHWTLRRSVRCSRSQRPVSVFSARNTPVTSPNFPPVQ